MKRGEGEGMLWPVVDSVDYRTVWAFDSRDTASILKKLSALGETELREAFESFYDEPSQEEGAAGGGFDQIEDWLTRFLAFRNWLASVAGRRECLIVFFV